MLHLLRNSPRLVALSTLTIAGLGLSLCAQEAHLGNPGRTQNFGSRTHTRTLADENQFRIREGTKLIDREGFFREDGDGAMFVSDDKVEMGALPNLNLERIVRTLKNSDDAQSIRWSVSGIVTEFNGRNHLLISRAVYKSSAPPPIPEHILN